MEEVVRAIARDWQAIVRELRVKQGRGGASLRRYNKLLDSSVLITHLRQMPEKTASGPKDAKAWVPRLIDREATNCVATPVVIEVLAGTSDPHDLELTEAFLVEFDIVDKGDIKPQDWEKAKQIAKRVVKLDREVPRKDRRRSRQRNPKTKSRQLGDCLIQGYRDSVGVRPGHRRSRDEATGGTGHPESEHTRLQFFPSHSGDDLMKPE